MNLEDHLGDIVRKARAMSGVTAGAAAKTTGLSEADFLAMEESGIVRGKSDWAALARALDLHPEKLEGMARGWQPAEPDLGRWRHLRQITTTEGGNPVHCYLAWDEASRDAALFDTGWDAGPVVKVIEEHRLKLCHLFITHTHPDHVAGLGDLRRRYPEIALHTDARSAPAAHRNRRDATVQLGRLGITHRATPGHAEDGVTYVITGWPDGAPEVAVVGDAIFAGSMGRGNQSWELARAKVRQEILSLPPDTLLCPGHGPVTTVAEETAHNPFF